MSPPANSIGSLTPSPSISPASSTSCSPVPSTSSSDDMTMLDLTMDQTMVLNQFRDWILSEPQIINPVVDNDFLLRFLNYRGFELKESCDLFKRYIKVRDSFPHCYKTLDILDPGVLDLMKRGYLFPLFERDSQGRTVIFGRGAMFNQMHGHKPTDLFRSIIMTLELLMDNDEDQKKGFVYIFDQEHICLSEVTYLGVFELQRLARSGEKSLPIKHKEVHWLNLPPLIMTCFYLISSFVTEKLRKRLFLHKNLTSLQESVDPTILPKEYGGSIPWREMSQRWVDTLTHNRDRLMSLDRMSWDDSNNKKKITYSLFQSIRKSIYL